MLRLTQSCENSYNTLCGLLDCCDILYIVKTLSAIHKTSSKPNKENRLRNNRTIFAKPMIDSVVIY